jgi:hypothetical protein
MDDIDLLPEELRARSINDQEIVLSYSDVHQAIDILEATNWALLGCEGWLHFADGMNGFAYLYDDVSREEGEAWDAFVRRSAAVCRAGIREAEQRWRAQPARTDAALFYCLTSWDGIERE